MAAPPAVIVVEADGDTAVIVVGGGSGGVGPAGPPGPTGPTGPAGATGQGVPTGGTTSQVLTKNSATNYDTSWQTPTGGGGTGVTDGDKGDIVVSASGATWMFDTTVVTAAAKTVLDDTTTAAMLTTLGAASTTAMTTADALKADKATTVTTTAPLTGTGTLGAALTLGIADFTTTTRGAVPNPATTSGRFLKDDGTWALPPAGATGAGNVFPFLYNSTTVEAGITGNQLRGNNSTFTASTKLWIMETTVDGLDVTVGLGRIKAGFQVYVQNYTNAAQYAIFNVTADSVDNGTHWELTVALASSAGTIPTGKIALQSLSAAQASKLFSTTTTAPGLAPGSNGATTQFLRGDGTWTAASGPAGPTGPPGVVQQATAPTDTTVLWADTTQVGIEENVRYLSNNTATSYTLVLADRGKLILCANASAQTVTVPTNATAAFVVGTQLDLVQTGAGVVTVAAAGGVTVNATPSLVLRSQYSAASLIKTATNTWLLIGDLT